MSENFEETLLPTKAQQNKKGWGTRISEDIIGEIYAYHFPNEKYEHILDVGTVKVLYLNKYKKLSLHFHDEKQEIFLCCFGSVEVETIEKNGKKRIDKLNPGDRIFIPRCTPHRIQGLQDLNILVEVSTLHKDSDSFRIEKGD